MGRGLERRELFTEDREREHFLDLLAVVHETHGLVIHAYVLMDNHLVVRTPQWLTTEAILVRSGGAELDRQKNYCSYVRRRLAEGPIQLLIADQLTVLDYLTYVTVAEQPGLRDAAAALLADSADRRGEAGHVFQQAIEAERAASGMWALRMGLAGQEVLQREARR